MRRFFIFLFLVLVSVSFEAAHIGYSLYSQKQKLDQTGSALAKQQTAITTVNQVSFYNGKDSYLVVEGSTEQSIPIIAWFKEDKLVRIEYMKDTISRQDIEAKSRQEGKATGKTRITPGIENQIPIWEIQFTDQEGKLNYLYYNMQNGNFIHSYRLV